MSGSDQMPEESIVVEGTTPPPGPYKAVLQSNSGIGGYDLRSPSDRAFNFDPFSSGKNSFLVLYRPGSGTVWILWVMTGGAYYPIYKSEPANQQRKGIGGYDLMDLADRGFAFDYDSSGKLDHLVFYRPDKGAVSIVKLKTADDDSRFQAVYRELDKGIGGYDLQSPADRGFAFDYDSSGKLDHLVFYRPGAGTIYIVKKESGEKFAPVYQQGSGGGGIGGYDLMNPADRGFAFDYDSSGKLDHLVFYRPGTGGISIIGKDSKGTFQAVYESKPDTGPGIASYNLKDPRDRVIALDYAGVGTLNYLLLYRPGTGKINIVARDANQPKPSFTTVFGQYEEEGVGGYDLRDPGDRIVALDYRGDGREKHLLCYRPVSQFAWILAPK